MARWRIAATIILSGMSATGIAYRAAAADVQTVFERGGWTGSAFTDGGRFTACMTFSNLPSTGFLGEKQLSNMVIGLVLSADGTWGAAFRKAVGKFQTNRHYSMTLVVDGREIHRGTASVDKGSTAILQPPLSQEAMRALRSGDELIVETDRGREKYSLAGSGDAIELTAKCVADMSRPPARQNAQAAPPTEDEVRRLIDKFAESKPDFDLVSGLMPEILPRIRAAYPSATTWQQLELAYVEAKRIEQERSKPKEKGFTAGTAFFVTGQGHLLTNAHVVEGCSSASVMQPGGEVKDATIIARDPVNDLALLRTNLRVAKVAQLRSAVRTGEVVATYGFPYFGTLPTTGNFTTGNVTATAGLQNDSRMLQVSVPVQSGNSGGPLVDQSGDVVGVVVAKLRAIEMWRRQGDLPQNVNFAVKASVARSFLEANGVSGSAGYADLSSAPKLAPEDLAEATRRFTVFIVCR